MNQPRIPRVGGVRCYWALLSPRYPNKDNPDSKFELVFVHPDPVLAVHLSSQRLSMMGRGVLEFIHPVERERARTDLQNAISLDDLQGSVTSVRFARLSHIRRLLGGKPEEVEVPFDGSKFAEDDEYLILDIVINWVASGLLLAFFHAKRDKDPLVNNDPNMQHEGWSNWCGTSDMGEDQIEALHANISTYIAAPPKMRHPPLRVFQLHTNHLSPTRPNQLLFSWPPPRTPGSKDIADGSYDAKEYANLMVGVEMTTTDDPSTTGRTRTTCTTRFGAVHSIMTEGIYRHVSSVFIPYGSLIFASYQTTKQIDLQPRIQTSSVPSLNSNLQSTSPQLYGLPTPSSTGDWPVWSRPPDHYAHPGVPAYSPSTGSSISSTPQPSFVSPPIPPSSQPMPQPSSHNLSRTSSQPLSQSLSLPLPLPQPPPQLSPEQFTYPPQLPRPVQIDAPTEPALPPIQPSQYNQYHPHGHHNHHLQRDSQPTPRDELMENQFNHQTRTTPTFASLPYPSYNTGYEVKKNMLASEIPSYPTPTPSTQTYTEPSPPSGSIGNGSRPLIRPPGNVECCRICGGRESPEWRRSETGIKDLCNACGLRLARQVAKREGKQKPRKKR